MVFVYLQGMKWWEHVLVFLKDHRQFLFLIVAIIVIRTVVATVYKRRKDLKKKDNFVIGINNVTLLLSAVWLFIFILHIMGITIREFFTSITIIAAALAIVFRDYILNGLNGMIMMFGDNYRIGDYIEIGEQKGMIEDLTLLNVHLKNDEDNMVIIPNNQLAAALVINYSKNPRHFSSIDFEIKSSHAISLHRLEAALASVLKPFEASLRKDSQQLRVVEYKADIIHYRYRYGLNKYDHPTAKAIKQLLYGELLKLLEVDKNQNKEN